LPPRKVELNDVDMLLLKAIRDIRAEKMACSVGALATALGYSSKTPPKLRLDTLRRMGYVSWSDAYGSIHLTAAGSKAAGRS
jgi:Mn-dependent DtxR family transcriptional regulator